MRIVIVLCMLLIVLPTWAGTWRDDFEDGNLDGWAEFGNAKWEVSDGRCKVSIPGGGDLAVFLMIGEPGWSNYSVEMEFQPDEPSMWIGLSVRMQDPENSYSWAVDCTDKTVHWITNVENQIDIITGNPVAVDIAGKNHTLKVVAEANELQGYYDGTHIRTVQLERFNAGKVAILVRTWSPPSSAFFDNVVITGNDISDVGPSGFSFNVQSKLVIVWGEVKSSRL